MFLIASFGLSGSRYIARYFQRCGHDVRHEDDGALGRSGWYALLEHIEVARVMGIRKYEPIIHLVRNPVNVMKSAYFMWTQSAFYRLYAHMSRYYYGDNREIPIYEDPVKNAMEGWTQYNQLISRWSSWRFKIEDFKQDRYKLFEKVGLEHPEKPPKMKPQDVHSKKNKKSYLGNLTVADLKKHGDIYPRMAKIARLYGYNL